MGGLLGRPRIDGLDELRKEVVERFNGQKILLVGPEGSGKSSLINAFEMALNLTDPKYPFMEFAICGPGKTGGYKDNPTTCHYRRYDKESLYHNLDKFLGDTPREKCPTFFDTSGLRGNDKISEKNLLVSIASGDVPEDTDLLSILKEETTCDDVCTEQNKELQSWSIVLVVGAQSDFPREIAVTCYDACQQLQRTAKDVRLFAVVTKVDTLHWRIKDARLQEVHREITRALAIPKTRIFNVNNIIPEDVSEDQTIKVNIPQRRGILRALKGILNLSQKPRWVYKETAAANQ